MSEHGQPTPAEPSELPPLAPIGPPHSHLEDLFAIVVGTFVVSLGIHLLGSVSAVTGGTAGVALLMSYGVPLSFGVLYPMVNLPFLLIALVKLGPRFTVASLASVAVVSGFAELQTRVLHLGDVPATYAIVVGNLLVGIGLLVLFRHGASLGGFSVLALLAQDRLGWRAGYVQMTMDVTVVLAGLAIVAPGLVLLSAVGAAVLNLVLALNHRPGRYFGA